MIRLTPLPLLLLCLTGCTTYEFGLTRPDNLRTHIARKVDAQVNVDPLQYRLRTVEGRLVMRIYNPTSDLVELIGQQSVVVDPGGQAHPLRSQTIAPDSFIKLILPPPRPVVERTGPSIGFGVGYSRGYGSRREHGFTEFDEPRYYSVYDEGNEYYWDWSGETDVRITLVYTRGGKNFRDEFVFHRGKV